MKDWTPPTPKEMRAGTIRKMEGIIARLKESRDQIDKIITALEQLEKMRMADEQQGVNDNHLRNPFIMQLDGNTLDIFHRARFLIAMFERFSRDPIHFGM